MLINSPRLRSILVVILFFLAISFFLILSLEIILRVFRLQSDNFLVQHPVLGWITQPNWKGRTVSSEFSIVKKTNREGFFNPDYSYEKPSDTFRIIVLGDSVTEALQVKTESSYPELIKKELANSVKKKIEVINLGVEGYGTLREYYMLKLFGLKYNPDLIIVGFFMGNDVHDNANENIDPDAQFSKSKERINKIKLFIRNHLTVYRFYKQKIARNKLIAFFKGRLNKNEQQLVDQNLPDNDIFGFRNYGPDPEVILGFEKSRSIIKEIVKLSEENRAKTLIAIIPYPAQVYEQFRLPVTIDYARPNQIITDFLEKENLAYIDILPDWRLWAMMNEDSASYGGGGISATNSWRKLILGTDSHPNKNGHQIIADAIVKYLINRQSEYGF